MWSQCTHYSSALHAGASSDWALMSATLELVLKCQLQVNVVRSESFIVKIKMLKSLQLLDISHWINNITIRWTRSYFKFVLILLVQSETCQVMLLWILIMPSELIHIYRSFIAHYYHLDIKLHIISIDSFYTNTFAVSLMDVC